MTKSISYNQVGSDRAASNRDVAPQIVPTLGSITSKTWNRDRSLPTSPTFGTSSLKKLRRRVSQLREQTTAKRLGLREQRVAIRQQHELVRSLEAQLLKQWQTLGRLVDQVAILPLHKELCTALDELGPLDQEYDEKEDELHTLEYDLDAKEKRLYKQRGQPDGDQSQTSPSTRPSSPSSSSEVLDYGPTDPPDITSPQYLYYSKLGEANMIRERLDEMEEEKAHYLQIEENRNTMSISLYEENVEFLADYPRLHSETLKELETIEIDLQRLRIQAGLNDVQEASDAGSFHESRLRADNTAEPAELERRSAVTELGHARPLDGPGLEPPRRKSEADVFNVPDDPRSSRDRINAWILERLRHSRLEQGLHKTILNNPGLDKKTWWGLVRKYWQSDSAARSSSYSSRHASGHSAGDERKASDSKRLSRSVVEEPFDASQAARRISSMMGDVDPSTAFGTLWTSVSTKQGKVILKRFAYLDLAINEDLPLSPGMMTDLHDIEKGYEFVKHTDLIE
ncbi:MAG: hypothetical protein Q9183_002736 [Haloplaca sp. 2 TL-2023]